MWNENERSKLMCEDDLLMIMSLIGFVLFGLQNHNAAWSKCSAFNKDKP